MSAHSDAKLTVNLGALAHNWRTIRDNASPATCGAVVKANAYGLGVAQVAPHLQSIGCEHFFVATLDEAIALRTLLPNSFIAVFNGVREGQTSVFIEHNFTPILNTLGEVELWQNASDRPAILHMDTGMNRLGLTLAEAETLDANKLNLAYVMSHLACADEPEHPMNTEQLKAFNQVRHLFPNTPASFSNSHASLDKGCYHFDLVRPGICMYGSERPLGQNMKAVATLNASVIQLREVDSDGSVGYCATAKASKGDCIAILPIGYADGYARALSNKGKVAFGGKLANVIGRVSMDLIAVDVTHLPEVQVGTQAELLGEHIKVDFLADLADTIAYEILTSLGSRFSREYINE